MKVFIILILFFPGIMYAQHQESQVIAYNIGFGGLTAGVGAVFNKKKSENWKTSFIRGFWQGCIGGGINYASKKTIYLVSKKNNLGYAVPARLLNAAGNSIIYNAAYNGPFLQKWTLEYGFLRFDYSAKAEKKLIVRILPVSIIGSALAMPHNKFDVTTTLLSGVMTFVSNDLINTDQGKHDGINYGRAFIYMDDSAKYHIVSHEIIHEYQYREYLVFNAYLHPSVSKMEAPGLKNIFTNYVYPDVPYFGLFYMMEGVSPSPTYFTNYYEFEAERMATNKFVHKN